MKSLHMSHWNGFSKGIILCLFMALGCLFLSGCFGSKAPERTYFSIDYTLGTQPKYNAPKFNKSVVIQNVTSALAYDRQEIVYRANPYEFQYYWYRLWATKPRKMLPELISGHLRYTNIFKTVSTTIEDRLPDYILDIEINAIEELDVSETEWYAHLALRFTLQRTEDSANVWTYSFDVRRPVNFWTLTSSKPLIIWIRVCLPGCRHPTHRTRMILSRILPTVHQHSILTHLLQNPKTILPKMIRVTCPERR